MTCKHGFGGMFYKVSEVTDFQSKLVYTDLFFFSFLSNYTFLAVKDQRVPGLESH